MPVLTPASRTGNASTNTNPYLQPQSAVNRGADSAMAMLGKPVVPELSPSGQRRHEEEQKFISSSPFYQKAGPLIDEAANASYDFFQAQEELAKPVKRNQGESNLSYATRATGTKFAPGIASQGYKAAEVVVPALRASTLAPQVIGKVSNAFLPEAVSSRLTPLFQAYSVLRSPDKWAALGNIGIDYGTDFASKLFTGKTLFENIDQSSLPDWGKGTAKTGYNIVSGLAGAKAGTKVGKYVGDVAKAGKAAIPSIAEGRRVYNETGSFDQALDAMSYKNLELEKGLKNAITGESEVKGFQQVPKDMEPLAQEALKYKSADEFVRSHGTPIYHGSDKKINTFSNKKGSQGVIWFADNPKPITSGESGAQGIKYINERVTTGKKFAGWDEYEKYGLGQIKDMGFDGIKLPTSMQDGTKYNDYIFFDNNTLKTKSELTDLWNQAHSQTQGSVEVKGFQQIPKNLEPLAQEALKYKSAEEFVNAQNKTGLFNEYNPSARSGGSTVENTPLTQLGYNATDELTVYRGVPKGVKSINDGDWVTTSKQLAKDYAGTGDVISMKVKASRLFAESGDDALDELVYSAKPKLKESQLADLWNQAHSQKQGSAEVKGFTNIPKEYEKNLVKNSDGSFSFKKNTEKAPNLGSKFAQDIEPAGNYINLVEKGEPLSTQKGWVSGTVNFKNPLVVDWKTSGHGGWKTDLSEKFGATGKELSKKIAEAGYDAIVTVDKGNAMEVVDLSNFKPTSSVKGFTNIPKPIDPATVPVTPKVVEQKFRGDKLNLEPEQLKQIEDRLSGLGLTSRTVRSFDEMKSMADELGTDPRALLSGNGKLTDAKVIALKNLINQNSEFIAKNSGLKFKTEQENAIHQQKLRAADAQQNEALSQLIGGGTELGRGIAAFRILANKNMEPSFWYKKGQQTRGNTLTPEQKANIDGLIKENDRVGLSMYVASLRDPSLSEKFSTLWKAGLLTNVTTHVANVAGNASMAGLRGVSNVVGTGIDKLISLGTGKRTMTVSPGAAVKGLGTGAKKGLSILRTGVNPDDFEGKFDIKGNINFGDSVLGKVANGYTRAVFGSLQAEDALFRGMHESASIANQAKLIAINEGLKGQARQTRIAELLENPTDAMKQTALQEAKVATFNNDNIVASKIGQLKAGRNKDDSFGSKALSTIVDVTMPFVKTPTNVVARIAEYTPLGLLKLAAGQLNKNTRGQKRLVEDLSKVVTGGAVLALGSALANQGLLTGSMPASAAERAQWEAEGKQPNSVYVNGRWYQINKLAPIGFLFALAADNKTSGGLAETGLKGLKNLTDQTFLTGLSGGLKAVTDPEQNAASYAKQTVSSVIPSGLNAIAKVIDPTVRTTGGVGEAIQAKIPGLSSSLAPRLDVFGQEVKNEGGVLGLLDPTRSKADKSNDPVLREFAKLGVNVGLPSNRMFNTTLDTYEYAEFQKVNGRVLKDVLDTLVVSPIFQNASTAKKEELLEKTVTKVRAQTKAAVFPRILQKRLDLPEVQNPEILNEIANKLYKNETFNAMSKEKQRQFVLDIVQQL